MKVYQFDVCQPVMKCFTLMWIPPIRNSEIYEFFGKISKMTKVILLYITEPCLLPNDQEKKLRKQHQSSALSKLHPDFETF